MCKHYDRFPFAFPKPRRTGGLGLVGSSAFIARAHRWRKMFGGGGVKLVFSQRLAFTPSTIMWTDWKRTTSATKSPDAERFRNSRLTSTRSKPTWSTPRPPGPPLGGEH